VLRLESSFWFVTILEFTTRFLVPPEDLQYNIVKIQSEEGSGEIEGVLARVQPGDPPDLYRKITLYHDSVLQMCESILPEGAQLREGHALDLFSAMSSQRVAARPQVSVSSMLGLESSIVCMHMSCTHVPI
jgi:hypothetical protein